MRQGGEALGEAGEAPCHLIAASGYLVNIK